MQTLFFGEGCLLGPRHHFRHRSTLLHDSEVLESRKTVSPEHENPRQPITEPPGRSDFLFDVLGDEFRHLEHAEMLSGFLLGDFGDEAQFPPK